MDATDLPPLQTVDLARLDTVAGAFRWRSAIRDAAIAGGEGAVSGVVGGALWGGLATAGIGALPGAAVGALAGGAGGVATGFLSSALEQLWP